MGARKGKFSQGCVFSIPCVLWIGGQKAFLEPVVSQGEREKTVFKGYLLDFWEEIEGGSKVFVPINVLAREFSASESSRSRILD